MTSDWRQWAKEMADPLAVFLRIGQTSYAEMKLPGAADLTHLMIESLLDASRQGDEERLGAIRAERALITEALAEAFQHVQDAGQMPIDVSATDFAEAMCAMYIGARLALVLDPTKDTDGMLAAVAAVITAAAKAEAAKTR
jgi:hypothetical protein